jgi:hypothetical protein
MTEERQTIYNEFSDTGKYSTEWVRITKEFLKLAFVGNRREVSWPCSRCKNRRMLSEYEMSTHLTKKSIYVELPYVALTQGGKHSTEWVRIVKEFFK